MVLLACGIVAAGCAAPEPRASGEPLPQVLHAGPGDPLATCGGTDVFHITALEGPDVANEIGPEFDRLREVIERYDGQEPETPLTSNWRLLVRSENRALFLADSARGPNYVRLERDLGGWNFRGSGDCQLHMVLGAGVGSAQWWVDPRRPAPTADSTSLEILLRERACASGSYATGRIVPPLVVYAADSITITMGVREIGGTCPGSPATPAVVMLEGQIGDRVLLDGYHIPPQPARPPL